jgi:hypothetical protein
MDTPQTATSPRTLIAIDQTIVAGYQQALSESLQLLAEAYAQRDALKRQADADQLMNIRQACSYLGKNEDTLRYYRRFGLEPYKKGQQGVWYRKGEIDAWLALGRVNQHTR